MAMTTDFSGTYDYEAEEARSEFDFLMDGAEDYTTEELHARVEKLSAHWKKVLDADGFRDFMLAWNTCCNDAKLGLGFYIID